MKPAAETLMTLPQLCAARGLPLDVTRREIRRTPELRALGAVYGPVRLFSAVEAERIAEVMAKRAAAAEVA